MTLSVVTCAQRNDNKVFATSERKASADYRELAIATAFGRVQERAYCFRRHLLALNVSAKEKTFQVGEKRAVAKRIDENHLHFLYR